MRLAFAAHHLRLHYQHGRRLLTVLPPLAANVAIEEEIKILGYELGAGIWFLSFFGPETGKVGVPFGEGEFDGVCGALRPNTFPKAPIIGKISLSIPKNASINSES